MAELKQSRVEEKTLAVVRQISDAFRQVSDFESFARGLERVLGKAEFFDHAAIALSSGPETGEGNHFVFPSSSLCLPLQGEEQVNGLVRFSNDRHEFGPEDLHLMAGLGDLLGVLVDHALRFGEQRRNLALLAFLLNQVPVGVVCFNPARQILVSNPEGRGFLGLGSEAGDAWLLPEAWQENVNTAGPSGEFHRRVAGKLLHVHAKRTSSGLGNEVTVLVLSDLTPEQDRFHECLARETYRCGWLGRPVSLVIVGATSPGGIMGLLRPFRERFGQSAIIGPCDSDALGIIFPETTFPQAMERFRDVRSHLQDDWQGGVASSNEAQGNPETLFAAAAAARCKVGDFLKRRLLLHDDYASVNDMLELVLRDDFTLLKSGNFSATMAHLRTGCFDGFFSEIDLSNGGNVLELARVAREANPDIRSFFTSCAASSRRESGPFQKEIVFQKPFDVREVVGTVKGAFS